MALGTLVSPASLIPFSLARTGQLMPAGSIWMYVGVVVAFAALLTYSGTLLPTWMQLRRRPLDAVAPT